MNGAQALIRTLVDGGVDVCFANPGTSEMHFVAALDAVPAMRGVLALFEGVATGAADGYARMADKPAAVLLHLGPGLGNGLANLHNARARARAGGGRRRRSRHLPQAVRRPTGIRHRRPGRHRVGLGAAHRPHRRRRRRRGRRRSPPVGPRSVSTLILPADVSWSDGAQPGAALCRRRSRPLSTPRRCARRPSRCAPVSRRSSSSAATPPGRRVCPPRCGPPTPRVHGCCARRSPPGWSAGRECRAVERLAYFAEAAQAQLAGCAAPDSGRCDVAGVLLRLPR